MLIKSWRGLIGVLEGDSLRFLHQNKRVSTRKSFSHLNYYSR